MTGERKGPLVDRPRRKTSMLSGADREARGAGNIFFEVNAAMKFGGVTEENREAFNAQVARLKEIADRRKVSKDALLAQIEVYVKREKEKTGDAVQALKSVLDTLDK